MATPIPTAGAQGLVKQIYRQVLEREADPSGLTYWSRQLNRGELTVREVVRLIGQSDEYRTRFVIPVIPAQAAKLMYKHFLARAPENQQVLDGWATVIVQQGYKAAVDGFVDSDEYSSRFGDNTVPHS